MHMHLARESPPPQHVAFMSRERQTFTRIDTLTVVHVTHTQGNTQS